MKKYLLAALCCSGIAMPALAQNGELPPVNFPANTNVCDPSPWKMILYDEFDGNRLSNKWVTFNSFAGMGNDYDSWSEGRAVKDNTSVYKDEDVIVSGGTCKLLVQYRPGTAWHCDTCSMDTVIRDYTSGYLATPYQVDSVDNSFNSGKFEARLRLPIFDRAHSTMWLWNGDGVNEIDITESYGDPFFPWFIGRGGNNRYNDFSLHSWPPLVDNPTTNPYQMTPHEIFNRYPHQTWMDWVRGTYHRQQDWHTYTCEWDTAVINTYLDGELVGNVWKYYQVRSTNNSFWNYRYNVGSSCTPSAGPWRTRLGFPYNNKSYSNLRFSVGVEDNHANYHADEVLGQMEIDYVKIWQRHPADDHHTDICPTPQLSLMGPDIICGSGTADYTLGQPVPNAQWSVTPGISLPYQSSAGNATATIGANAPDQAIITCTYGETGCPRLIASKSIDLGVPVVPVVIAARTSLNNSISYNLSATRRAGSYHASTTFEWTISYGQGFSRVYHATGQYVRTPVFYSGSESDFGIRWTVKVTNNCGSRTTNGQLLSKFTPLHRGVDSGVPTADSVITVQAAVSDAAAYELAISNRVAATTFAEGTGEEIIQTKINQIAMEELAPYLLFDEQDDSNPPAMRGVAPASGTAPAIPASISIYPIPAHDYLNVACDGSGEGYTFQLTDITGRPLLLQPLGGIKAIDLTLLANGLYLYQIMNGSTAIRQGKLVKQ